MSLRDLMDEFTASEGFTCDLLKRLEKSGLIYSMLLNGARQYYPTPNLCALIQISRSRGSR